MAEDLGGLFDSDPGFLEELASGSRVNPDSSMITQPGGVPQTAMIGQPQVPIQNATLVNQMQMQQGFATVSGDSYTAGGQFQQQQMNSGSYNQFNNQMGQQVRVIQGQGQMQDSQQARVQQMMSPHRNPQFVESQPGIGHQQAQGQFHMNMAGSSGPRLPNPQQQVMMNQGQMQGWNVQMYNPQQQGQTQLSHHDYAASSNNSSNTNFQNQILGNQATFVQQMTSQAGVQGTSQAQPNRMPVRQTLFANPRMPFAKSFSVSQPGMTNMSSDQLVMQQQQQQQQQQFMQRQQQPQTTIQVQQFRFQQSPQVQQAMIDTTQQNMVRFSQTSPNQGSGQHRLPFTSMPQQRQNVPMLSPRPTPPPPSPAGSQGVLSPTGSTSVSQANFVQNVGLPSGNSGNLFNQGANTEINVNDVNQQKHFNVQGQVSQMISPPQGATNKANPMMSPPQGGNPNNLSQIASPKPNSNSVPVNVNINANVNRSSNNFPSGPTQVSPTNKVLSPNMNSPPQNVNQEVQAINQQIQQLYNLPQTQDTQQKMLDLQERLRMIKSQQMLTTQRQPQQPVSSQQQVMTNQPIMTEQTNQIPQQQGGLPQQGSAQQNVTEQPNASTQLHTVPMQQKIGLQQQQQQNVQQINFAAQQQNTVSLQQQNPSVSQQSVVNMQPGLAGPIQQPGPVRLPAGAVQQQGAPGQQGLTFKINAQPGQKIQFVRGPAQPGGGPQKIFIIQQSQVPNQQVTVQQQQQQQQPASLPVPATVNISQPVSSSQPLLKTIPQPQHVIINTSLSSGGNTRLGQAQVVHNVTAMSPQKIPVPVQVQLPQTVVQNATGLPQAVQSTTAQSQNTPVQIVHENEQDSNSSVTQQQEKANKIIAEAIAKAQRTGTGSTIPRVLSPPELPSTLADVDNPDSTSTPNDTPSKPKRKRKPREPKKDKTGEKTPRRKKEKVKVEATDETSNVDVENTPDEGEEVKEKKRKRKREGGEKKPKGEKSVKLSAKKSKKPPATFLKSRKRKRRGSSDGSDVEIKYTPPPSPENDDLKRRSGRHTKRKKYMDELDLNLSDEDTMDATGDTEGAVVKPVQLFVENPAEEDAVVVEKILGSRMRTKDADVSNDEEEEDDVEEYYVKYKNFSYLHCEWKTEKELMKDKRIPGKIRRYKMKKANIYNYFSSLEDEELFNPEYVEVDRVLEESITLDPSTNEEVTHYLVKWRGLPYEDSTWELQQDVDPEKVRLFKKVRELPDEEDRVHVRRPSSGSDWEPLKETHEYKGGNTLRDYQLEGVNWLTFSWYKRQNCILADEMGLGKTIQSITFLHEIFSYGIKGPFLVIAPLSTIANWMREFDLWTDMNVIVYHGTSPSRFMLQEYEMYYRNERGQKITDFYKFHVIITTYELIISDIEILRHIDWRCVIIDEAHRLKNKNCRLMEGLRFFDFEHKVLLSGTPLQNNVEELFSLLNFLEPSQFHSSEAFLAEFGTLKTEEQVDKLKAILKPMMLRRLKEDVEKNLAAKEETIIEVELTNIQKKYYRAILERNFSFLHKGSQSSANVPNLMNTMMELRKCCNHPYLINGAEENILSDMRTKQQNEPDPIVYAMIQASGKFVLLDKLLPKLKQSGHKVLIFSQMIRVLDILEDYLVHKRYLYERIDGRITGNLRQEAIDRFSKPDSDRFVFLLCTRAGGLGINLTAADTVIIYDSDWNPQNDLQAQARCHRIGQVRMVKVYRLITRNSYEREMFDRASMKLGLDKAVLQSMGGEKINPQAQLSKREIEELLRKGAYGALMEDDSAGDAFCEEDIDQILQRRTQVIQIESEGKGSTFAKASFSMTSNRDDIDINDPEFWQKWAKKADVDVDAGEKELIIEEPRVRKKTTRYGNDNGVVDMSDLASSSDSDTDSKSNQGRGRRGKRKQDEDTDFESERHVAKSHGPGYGRSELFKVEKGLLVFGWGRWSDIVCHANWKRHMEEKDVEKVSRAILIYSLQHYKGDERIKEFIWDLVSPAGEASLKNHSGLSAPVPRGRKGRKNKEVVKEEKSFSMQEAKVDLKVDPDIVLGDNGYKKHLHRHSNKVLLRVRTLYYLKQEVIGDAAESISKGVNVADINIPLPAVDVDPPSYWWDEDADKSLLIGVYKHGYEKYNLMRQDPTLTFLLRCGPPDGAALAAEMKMDDDDDDKVDQSIVNENDEEDESVLSVSDVTSAKRTPAATPGGTEEDEEEKLPFPTVSDLNTRLRRIITNYQRDYKKQQMKKEAQAKKIEKREKMDALYRERESRRRETQQRWVRREETDFYRVVSTYGIEFDRRKGRYVWDKFSKMAKLEKKTDDQLTEYFISFYHMCLRVCKKIKEDAYPPTPLFVEAITEERANRCIARIDLLSKIREEVIIHPRFETRIKLCETSYDLPSWWINGKHDRELIIGAAKHGLARTDVLILNDPQFSFKEYCKYDPGSQPNSPANFRMFGKDIGKTKDVSDLARDNQNDTDAKIKEERTDDDNIKKESLGDEDDTLSNHGEPGEVKTKIIMSDFIKKEDKGDNLSKTVKKENEETELVNGEIEDLKTDLKQEMVERNEDDEKTNEYDEDTEEESEVKEEKAEQGEEKEKRNFEIKEEKNVDAGNTKEDDEDAEVRRTFEEGEHSRTEFLDKVREGLSAPWPKDRVIFHRLEHICYCIETGEWPFGKKMPNQHILGIDSGSTTPVTSRTPNLTPGPKGDEETSNALQEMVKATTKREKDFEVQLSEGDGLKLTFHKRAKGRQERPGDALEAEKAARIQQILAQSVAASTASSDESRPDSTLSTSQPSDSMFMNGSPSVEAEMLMNQSLIEQGLMYPGRRRGRKRKAEKLAEIAMAEALARRQTARAIASYEPESRVPVINLEDGSRLSGDSAPMKKDLDVWLVQHPGYVIDSIDDELEEGEISSDYPERRRGRKPKVDPAFLDVDKLTGEENVSVINRLTGKKITGAKAPPLRYLGEWLEQNPMWDVDPKWSDLVRAKGSLPKQLLPRVVTPSRRGRGRPARDSPVSHSMLGNSDPHAAAALAASMEAMNAAQLMAAGIPKLPLPFGSLPGLGMPNPLFGLSGLGIPGLPGTPPLSKDSDSKRKDPEEKESTSGESKSPHPSFPMLYNPLLYNPLFAAQGLAGFPLPTSLSSQLPGLSSRLINGHAQSDSEEEPKVSKSRRASEQLEQDEAEDLSVKSEKKVIENLQEAHSSGKHKPESVLDESEQPCDLSMKSKSKEEPKTKIIGSDKLSRIVDSLKDRVNKMDGKPVTGLTDKVKEGKKSKLDSLLFSLSQDKQLSLPAVSSPPPERRASLTERRASESDKAVERRPSLSDKQVVLDRHSSSKLTSHTDSSLTKKSSLLSTISQTSSHGVKPSTKEPVPQIVQELLAAKQMKDAAKLQKEAELAFKQQKAIEALVAKQRQMEDVMFLKKQAAETKLLKQKASSSERAEKTETAEKGKEGKEEED